MMISCKTRVKLVKLASEPISRDLLISKLGFDAAITLNQLVRLMRSEGHVIWLINSSTNQYEVWYKSGPQIVQPVSNDIADLLANDWYTYDEIESLLDSPAPYIKTAIRRLSKKTTVYERLIRGGVKEFTTKKQDISDTDIKIKGE